MTAKHRRGGQVSENSHKSPDSQKKRASPMGGGDAHRDPVEEKKKAAANAARKSFKKGG